MFMRSLTVEALTWYIEQVVKKQTGRIDMASDFMECFGFNIDNLYADLKRKPNNSFRDYTIRWSSEDARARPPIEESQITKYFIQEQEPQYLEKMITIIDKSFFEIIKEGEMLKGLKNGSTINLEALQATNKTLQSRGIYENKNKKEVGTKMGAQALKNIPNYQAPTTPRPPYP